MLSHSMLEIDFVRLDQPEILQLAWRSNASQAAAKQISKVHGIRWSVLNELPGWTPHGSAPFDPMHNLYLGKLFLNHSSTGSKSYGSRNCEIAVERCN